MNWKMKWKKSVAITEIAIIEWMKWTIKKAIIALSYYVCKYTNEHGASFECDARRTKSYSRHQVQLVQCIGQWTDEQYTHTDTHTQLNTVCELLLFATRLSWKRAHNSILIFCIAKTARWRCHTAILINGKLRFTRIEATSITAHNIC